MIFPFLSRKPKANPVSDVALAKARYDAAVLRGDTRAQGQAWPALFEAQTARLQDEVYGG